MESLRPVCSGEDAPGAKKMSKKDCLSVDIQIKLLIRRLLVAILAGELIRHEHELWAVIMRGSKEDAHFSGQHCGEAPGQLVLNRRTLD